MTKRTIKWVLIEFGYEDLEQEKTFVRDVYIYGSENEVNRKQKEVLGSSVVYFGEYGKMEEVY